MIKKVFQYLFGRVYSKKDQVLMSITLLIVFTVAPIVSLEFFKYIGVANLDNTISFIELMKFLLFFVSYIFISSFIVHYVVICTYYLTKKILQKIF